VAGADDFTPTHIAPIVVSWVANLTWTIWMAVIAQRTHGMEPAALGDGREGRRRHA
jgi:hypothetical protein